MWRYDAASRFEALAQMKSVEWRSFDAKIKLNWARQKAADGKEKVDAVESFLGNIRHEIGRPVP